MAKLKDNPLACGLLGFIIGAGGILGGQAMMEHHSKAAAETAVTSVTPVVTNFDRVPYDEDGDVFITPNGKKYHRAGCYTLSKSKETRRVNSYDAEDAGLQPCSRCFK